MWWAQGSLTTAEAGSRADVSPARTGSGTCPFGVVRYQSAKRNIFYKLRSNFCWQRERSMKYSDTKEKQTTTRAFDKAQRRKRTPTLISRSGIRNGSNPNHSTRTLQRSCPDTGVRGCAEGWTSEGCQPQSWCLVEVTWERRGGTLCARLARAPEGKCYQQNCVYRQHFCWEHSPVQLWLVSRWTPGDYKSDLSFNSRGRPVPFGVFWSIRLGKTMHTWSLLFFWPVLIST